MYEHFKFIVHLVSTRIFWPALNQTVCALRFFYGVTLGNDKIPERIEATTALFVLVGGAFPLLGSVGLARLPDFFTRLHGPTKATTLSVGALLIGSMLHLSTQGNGLTLRELAMMLFLFITAPVSAHLMSKAALKGAQKLSGSTISSAARRPLSDR